jgi:hypothetical protein
MVIAYRPARILGPQFILLGVAAVPGAAVAAPNFLTGLLGHVIVFPLVLVAVVVLPLVHAIVVVALPLLFSSSSSSSLSPSLVTPLRARALSFSLEGSDGEEVRDRGGKNNGKREGFRGVKEGGGEEAEGGGGTTWGRTVGSGTALGGSEVTDE